MKPGLAYPILMRYRQLPKIRCRRNKDGSKTWWAEWWHSPVLVDGKRTRPHHSAVLGDCRTTTKGEARERLEGLLNANPISQTWTVENFVRRVWLPPRIARWAYNTRRENGALLKARVLPTFGAMELGAVLKCQIEQWFQLLSSSGYSRSTGRALLVMVRSIWSEAEDNGLVERNPTLRIKLPAMRLPERTEPYTMTEVRALMAVKGLDGLAMRVMAFSGLRPGEMLALKAGDVRGRELVVDESVDYTLHTKAPKTGVIRMVGMPPRLAADMAALAGGLSADELLFSGVAHSVNALGDRWKRLFGGIAPGFNLRRFRATCATLLTGDPADVADLLGHDPAITMRHYRRAIPERQLEALERLEMEAVQ